MILPRALLHWTIAAVLAAALVAGTAATAPAARAATDGSDRDAAALTTARYDAGQRPTARRGCTKRCFGAISVNPKDGVAYSVINLSQKKAAVKTAQRRCKNRSDHPGQCRKAAWTRNACAAAAARVHDGQVVAWGGDWGQTKKRAIRKAKKAVRAISSPPGKIKKWSAVCTANS
ncbi:DUF4189 domain-containing protein [Nocardioides sp. YIM 152588]|uniref:DUF4189 domain-containing protein n=1 Tax=Nocardioides sp. YIM 152588 TaxID=3158259 RepID=UPI0032E46795